MRLSNLQALMLFQTLRDTAVIADGANVFTFNREQRLKLAQDIINQQNKELVELDTKHLVPLQENQVGTAAHGNKNEN